MQKYGYQLFDMAIAEQRGYALLGGSKEKYLIIKEAIEKVYSDLCVILKSRKNEIQTIPKEFRIPEWFAKELGEKESFRYCFDLWRVSELIRLLRAEGTLRKMLGQEEEEWLYDDFYIYGQPPTAEQYNNCSILGNCLLSVIGNMIKNEEALSLLPVLSDDQRIRTNHLIKKEAYKNWEKNFLSIPANILNRKLTSGRTVKEQYIFDRMNKLQQPIDLMEFEHRMNNLARTIYKDRLKSEPSFVGNKLKCRLSLRKLLETLTGKAYKELSTYEIKKTMKMLFENRNKEFTFFEMTTDGQVKVIYGELYDYTEHLLPEGKTDIAMEFDLSCQDFRKKKNYIYSDNKDFSICRQKKEEFWKDIETNQRENMYVKKIGARLGRVKNNKIFQAAPVKFLHFLRLNYYHTHPISLAKETFNIICGDIRTEAQSKSLAGKNRPTLTEAIIKVVCNMVIWIAKTSGWVRTIKVSKGSVIIVPTRSYFEKWQESKNLPKNTSKD